MPPASRLKRLGGEVLSFSFPPFLTVNSLLYSPLNLPHTWTQPLQVLLPVLICPTLHLASHISLKDGLQSSLLIFKHSENILTSTLRIDLIVPLPNTLSHFSQLVEPPSYADAIFAPPYMGSSSDTEISAATNGPSPSEAQPSTSRPNQLVLNISVTDPQKIIESAGSSLVPGSGTYVSYKVSVYVRSVSGLSHYCVHFGMVRLGCLGRLLVLGCTVMMVQPCAGYRGFSFPPSALPCTFFKE